MRVFIDTNVWVYTHDIAEPRKQQLALSTLAGLSDSEVVLSAQVLNEFFTVVTSRLARPLDRATAARAVEAMQAFTVAAIDSALVTDAIRIAGQASLSHWDALIVAAAARTGCPELLTEDLAAGSVIDGVRIVDPLGG